MKAVLAKAFGPPEQLLIEVMPRRVLGEAVLVMD